MEKFKIGDSEVLLDDYGEGRGKIIITDNYYNNYSYYWGSMGGTLKEFLKSINSGYFSNKLISHEQEYCFDVTATFKAVRYHIRYEMGLPFWEHMVFQKNMREILKEFQETCDDLMSQNYFIDNFKSDFIDRLDFYLIDSYHRKQVKDQFDGICEVWNFIEIKSSDKAIALQRLHKKLKKLL